MNAFLFACMIFCMLRFTSQPVIINYVMLFCIVSPLIAQKVISEEKDQCFRILNQGSCSLPILKNITKQICCCSRVGKAWGKKCEICPYFGSGKRPFRHSKNVLFLSNNCIGMNIFNAEVWAKSSKKAGGQHWEHDTEYWKTWFGFYTKSPTVPQGPRPTHTTSNISQKMFGGISKQLEFTA